MRPKKLTISWSGGKVGGLLYDGGRSPLLLAHGAGSDHHHPRMVSLAQALAGEGLKVLTFNYAYTEAGRKRPDPQPALLEVHRAARDRLMESAGREVVLAGRSMGGRMGTYLAAAGEPARALVLYAYPLHPPGQPDKLRFDHLPAIEAPMLFVQGTRDALSRMDLFDRYIRSLPRATAEVLEGATHALDRRPQETSALASLTASWLAGI